MLAAGCHPDAGDAAAGLHFGRLARPPDEGTAPCCGVGCGLYRQLTDEVLVQQGGQLADRRVRARGCAPSIASPPGSTVTVSGPSASARWTTPPVASAQPRWQDGRRDRASPNASPPCRRGRNPSGGGHLAARAALEQPGFDIRRAVPRAFYPTTTPVTVGCFSEARSPILAALMRAVDLIVRKRDGAALTREEIDLFVGGVTSGALPDYQASALLMAIVCAWHDRRGDGLAHRGDGALGPSGRSVRQFPASRSASTAPAASATRPRSSSRRSWPPAARRCPRAPAAPWATLAARSTSSNRSLDSASP